MWAKKDRDEVNLPFTFGGNSDFAQQPWLPLIAYFIRNLPDRTPKAWLPPARTWVSPTSRCSALSFRSFSSLWRCERWTSSRTLRCQEIPRNPVSMLFLKLMCRGLWLLPSWTFTPNTFIFCPFFMAYRYTPGLFVLLSSHPLAYIPSRHAWNIHFLESIHDWLASPPHLPPSQGAPECCDAHGAQRDHLVMGTTSLRFSSCTSRGRVSSIHVSCMHHAYI